MVKVFRQNAINISPHEIHSEAVIKSSSSPPSSLFWATTKLQQFLWANGFQVPWPGAKNWMRYLSVFTSIMVGVSKKTITLIFCSNKLGAGRPPYHQDSVNLSWQTSSRKLSKQHVRKKNSTLQSTLHEAVTSQRGWKLFLLLSLKPKLSLWESRERV